MNLKTTLITLAGLCTLTSALAADPGWSDAEVKRIDTARERITLKHGDIPNLEMPGMTMVFRVAKPEWLTQLKPGQQIQFKAEDKNGAITVTEIK